MKRIAALTALAAAALLAAGPARAGTQTARVQANDTETFTWTANGSGEVIFCIDGDGDTDLDIFVYDDNGNLIGQDRSLDDNEQVRIRVREGRDYEIVVENYGNVWNEFDLEIAFSDEHFNGRVQANNSLIYTYTAPQGINQVTATVHGDGDTDLDLYIYDSQGRLVAQSLGFDDHERIVFTPVPGEQYDVQISNLGNVWNQVDLDFEEAG